MYNGYIDVQWIHRCTNGYIDELRHFYAVKYHRQTNHFKIIYGNIFKPNILLHLKKVLVFAPYDLPLEPPLRLQGSLLLLARTATVVYVCIYNGVSKYIKL